MNTAINKFIPIFIMILAFGCGGGSGSDNNTADSGNSSEEPTAKCKDGTYSYSQNCSGTCSSHGGVDIWYTSSCGNSSSVQQSLLDVDLNGTWNGQAVLQTNGQLKPGTIVLNINEGSITGSYLCSSDNVCSLIKGTIDSSGLYVEFININCKEELTMYGGIEIDTDGNMVGNYNVDSTGEGSNNRIPYGIMILSLKQETSF